MLLSAKGKEVSISKDIKARWLRLTEEINALDYLERAYYYICQVGKDTLAWKWIVIALHGALYGFAISACRQTNGENVTYKTKKGKDILIGFDKALELCQSPNWMHTTTLGRHLELSHSQKKSIDKLKNHFRNRFEHYIPMAWSIEVHGMPQVAIDALDVIHFLALDASPFVHLTQAQRKKVKYIIFRSKRILSQSQLYKETKLLEEVTQNGQKPARCSVSKEVGCARRKK